MFSVVGQGITSAGLEALTTAVRLSRRRLVAVVFVVVGRDDYFGAFLFDKGD